MKIEGVEYAVKFVRNFKKLPIFIQKQALEKEEIFKKNAFDNKLKTHKLTEKLSNFYSFSVNYSYRIIFVFEKDNEVTFVDIGDRSIYK